MTWQEMFQNWIRVNEQKIAYLESNKPEIAIANSIMQECGTSFAPIIAHLKAQVNEWEADLVRCGITASSEEVCLTTSREES